MMTETLLAMYEKTSFSLSRMSITIEQKKPISSINIRSSISTQEEDFFSFVFDSLILYSKINQRLVFIHVETV